MCNDVLRFVDYSEVYVPTSNGQIDADEKRRKFRSQRRLRWRRNKKAEEKTENKGAEGCGYKKWRMLKSQRMWRNRRRPGTKEPGRCKESKGPKPTPKRNQKPSVGIQWGQKVSSRDPCRIANSKRETRHPESANAPKKLWATLAAIEGPKFPRKAQPLHLRSLLSLRQHLHL